MVGLNRRLTRALCCTQGVIYELSDEDWTMVYDRLGGSFVSVTVHAFECGDHDKRVGTYKAWLPTPPRTHLVPGLTPSLRLVTLFP